DHGSNAAGGVPGAGRGQRDGEAGRPRRGGGRQDRARARVIPDGDGARQPDPSAVSSDVRRSSSSNSLSPKVPPADAIGGGDSLSAISRTVASSTEPFVSLPMT